jgi:hypothetical protein
MVKVKNPKLKAPVSKQSFDDFLATLSDDDDDGSEDEIIEKHEKVSKKGMNGHHKKDKKVRILFSMWIIIKKSCISKLCSFSHQLHLRARMTKTKVRLDRGPVRSTRKNLKMVKTVHWAMTQVEMKMRHLTWRYFLLFFLTCLELKA